MPTGSRPAWSGRMARTRAGDGPALSPGRRPDRHPPGRGTGAIPAMKTDATMGPPDRGKAAVTVTELGHLASGVGHHVINAFAAVVSNAEILRLKLVGLE